MNKILFDPQNIVLKPFSMVTPPAHTTTSAIKQTLENAFSEVRYQLRDRLSVCTNAELANHTTPVFSGSEVVAIIKESLRSAAEKTLAEVNGEPEPFVVVEQPKSRSKSKPPPPVPTPPPLPPPKKSIASPSPSPPSSPRLSPPPSKSNELDFIASETSRDENSDSSSSSESSSFRPQSTISSEFTPAIKNTTTHLFRASPTIVHAPNRRTFLKTNVVSATKQAGSVTSAAFILYTIKTDLVVDDQSISELPVKTTFTVCRRFRDFDLLVGQLKTFFKAQTQSQTQSQSSQSQSQKESVYLSHPLIPILPPKRATRLSRDTSR